MELESRSDMVKQELMIGNAQNGLDVFLQAPECQISESQPPQLPVSCGSSQTAHPYEKQTPLGEDKPCVEFRDDSLQHAQIPGDNSHALDVVIHSARHLAECNLTKVGRWLP